MLFTELDVRDELAIGIYFTFILVAFLGHPFLFAIIPVTLGLAHHAHVAALHRLTKEIVASHFDGSILTGQIVRTIRLYVHREVRQIVSANPGGRSAIRVAVSVTFQFHIDAIITEPGVFRNLPIYAGDPKPRRVQLGPEGSR